MQPNIDPIPTLKRQIAARIAQEMSGLPQGFGANRMGTNQPRVSEICNGKLDRFSLEKLIRMVARLNCSVTIEITKVPRRYNQGLPARAENSLDRLAWWRRV